MSPASDRRASAWPSSAAARSAGSGRCWPGSTPASRWLGLCDIDEGTLKQLADDTDADFVTTDMAELLARPEVSAVIVATDEREHVEPMLQAPPSTAYRLFIEKPLATDPVDSAQVLAAIEAAGIDAVVGYTQRFRRRFLTVKQRLRDEPDRRGDLGGHPGVDEPDGSRGDPAQGRRTPPTSRRWSCPARTAST